MRRASPRDSELIKLEPADRVAILLKDLQGKPDFLDFEGEYIARNGGLEYLLRYVADLVVPKPSETSSAERNGDPGQDFRLGTGVVHWLARVAGPSQITDRTLYAPTVATLIDRARRVVEASQAGTAVLTPAEAVYLDFAPELAHERSLNMAVNTAEEQLEVWDHHQFNAGAVMTACGLVALANGGALKRNP